MILHFSIFHFLTVAYNDDPEFTGYDSDREERTRVVCEAHKTILRELAAENQELHRKLNENHQKEQEVCNAWNT